jgi:hypothetical protein
MKKLCIALLLLVIGCAPWVKAGGSYSSNDFSIELPDGWMRYNSSQYVLVTRDGTLLQNIHIKRIKVDEKLQHTKKKLEQNMLPQETAEVIIDDLASNPAILNFNVEGNSPAEISGLQGFKLSYTYKNGDDLRLSSVNYGILAGKWFYSITYTAPSRHYFDKDIETFDKVVASFKLDNIS